MKKCYIVSIGKPWNLVGYDWDEKYAFLNKYDAQALFRQTIIDLTDITMDDEGMTGAEAKEYMEGVEDNNYEHYCECPLGNWAVKLEEAKLMGEDLEDGK